jgi:hypothetical protein
MAISAILSVAAMQTSRSPARDAGSAAVFLRDNECADGHIGPQPHFLLLLRGQGLAGQTSRLPAALSSGAVQDVLVIQQTVPLAREACPVGAAASTGSRSAEKEKGLTR